MKKLIKFLPASLFLVPMVALAQYSNTRQLITGAGFIVQALIVLAAALALLVFLWGFVKFIFKLGSSEDAVEDGKRLMIWGVIGLFVMVSVWGLVRFIRTELFPSTDFNSPQGLPSIQQP